MADNASFRGYWAIKEVLERLDPLVQWTKQFKPQQRHITLAKKDYDLIRRWPKAAHVHQIECVGPDTWYHGLELTYDGGPGRYDKARGPLQQTSRQLIVTKIKIEKMIEIEVSLEDLSDNEVEEECERRGLMPEYKSIDDFTDTEIEEEYRSRKSRDLLLPTMVVDELYRTRAEVPQIVKDWLYQETGRTLP